MARERRGRREWTEAEEDRQLDRVALVLGTIAMILAVFTAIRGEWIPAALNVCMGALLLYSYFWHEQ